MQLTPVVAFALVSFSLGELGDGLNIFQGIYLVEIGWNEGSIGIALSLMGFTALIVQTWAGDIVDKTTTDRRIFLTVAAVITAISALMVMFVREGNTEHFLIFTSKIVEGIASSFIGPCLAALTLANFGPRNFDKVMASNILWGHIGSVVAAVLAGVMAYFLYPNIKYCCLVIGFSALIAVIFVRFVPEGDPLMGRGFQSSSATNDVAKPTQTAASYWEVFSDRKTSVLCVTGFFFHFANANVLLVLGELMGGDNEDGTVSQKAIPLIAGAIVLAQLTMAVATVIADKLTQGGVGRKIIFLTGLASLPIRCALIIFWRDSGDAYLLSTQILDGIGGGLFGLMHPYIIADITYGTGRFNVVMGLSASCFGLGGTLSNLLGQFAVEAFGHVTSLLASLILSVIPLILFGILMPETQGQRDTLASNKAEKEETPYENMATLA